MIPSCPICQNTVVEWQRPGWEDSTFKRCPVCIAGDDVTPLFWYRYQDNIVISLDLQMDNHVLVNVYWVPHTILYSVYYETSMSRFDIEKPQDIPRAPRYQEILRFNGTIPQAWFAQPINEEMFNTKIKFLLAFQ